MGARSVCQKVPLTSADRRLTGLSLGNPPKWNYRHNNHSWALEGAASHVVLGLSRLFAVDAGVRRLEGLRYGMSGAPLEVAV